MKYVTVFVDSSDGDRPEVWDNPTTRELHRLGIQWETIDVFMLDHPVIMWETLNRFGFREFPVVVSSAGAWSGHRPELIEPLHRAGQLDPWSRVCDYRSPNAKVIIPAEQSTDGETVFMSVVPRHPDDPTVEGSFRDRIMSAYHRRARGKGPTPEHRAEQLARREALRRTPNPHTDDQQGATA